MGLDTRMVHQELQAKLAMTLTALFQHGDAARLSFIVGVITLDRSEGELLLVMVMNMPVHSCLCHIHVQTPCMLTALLPHCVCVFHQCFHESVMRHCRCLHPPHVLSLLLHTLARYNTVHTFKDSLVFLQKWMKQAHRVWMKQAHRVWIKQAHRV